MASMVPLIALAAAALLLGKGSSAPKTPKLPKAKDDDLSEPHPYDVAPDPEPRAPSAPAPSASAPDVPSQVRVPMPSNDAPVQNVPSWSDASASLPPSASSASTRSFARELSVSIAVRISVEQNAFDNIVCMT